MVAGPLAVELLERLKQTADLARWDDGAAIADGKPGATAVCPGDDLDMAAGYVVPHGVVYQVGDQALGQGGVPGNDGRAEAGRHAHAPAAGVWLAAGHDPGGDLREIERLPVPQAALASGQREQRVDESFLLFPELEHLPAGGPQRFRARGGIGECHLQDGPLGCQGGAQLVGRVRDEVALRLECGLKAGEEPVERVTEGPELLVGAGASKP